MEKSEVIQTVREMIGAFSCCPELKAAGEAYLKAAGTADEKAAAAALIAEIREDISTVEHLIEFCESPLGARILGAEAAASMGAHGREIKAKGAKWCDCPACAAAVKILENAGALA